MTAIPYRKYPRDILRLSVIPISRSVPDPAKFRFHVTAGVLWIVLRVSIRNQFIDAAIAGQATLVPAFFYFLEIPSQTIRENLPLEEKQIYEAN